MSTWSGRAIAVLMVLGSLAAPLLAQDDTPLIKDGQQAPDAPKLTIGSRAPAITIREWAKGEKVDGLKPGQLYVVEFWATWCGPCIGSMPHLAQLQTKYADKVTMIGVSQEETSKVTDFLKQDREEGVTWDKTITYRIALDDEGKTSQAFMTAAGENGIPTAFVVGKDGVIEWIGHPTQLDEPLAKVVAGTWERAVAKKDREDAQAQELAMMKAQRDIRRALSSGNLDGAIKVLDDLIAAQPKARQLGFIKLQLLAQRENKDDANKYAEELVKKIWDDSVLLNDLGWGIAEQDYPGSLDTALKAATRAVELTKEKDGAIMDTLARVYFEQGKLDDAIAWSRKAVAAANHPEIAAALKKYEAAKAEKK